MKFICKGIEFEADDMNHAREKVCDWMGLLIEEVN
jgi:hypothetical protein